MNFAQQVVWVTGASRGIGLAAAQAFVQQGAQVIGTATTEEGAAKITNYLAAYGPGQALGLKLDVSDKTQCSLIFDQIVQRYGAPQVLINNAGITRDNLLLRMKDEEWNEVINVHLNALFYLSKLIIKPMIKARYGRIINMSSVVAATGNPGQINYCAAKAGMIGFSKALALEVASRGITVNAVAPGYIETDMTQKLTEAQKQLIINQIPAQKIGSVEDIAHVLLFLADVKTSYITGQTLHVNGGLYCGD